jgi:hypothetical protein
MAYGPRFPENLFRTHFSISLFADSKTFGSSNLSAKRNSEHSTRSTLKEDVSRLDLKLSQKGELRRSIEVGLRNLRGAIGVDESKCVQRPRMTALQGKTIHPAVVLLLHPNRVTAVTA